MENKDDLLNPEDFEDESDKEEKEKTKTDKDSNEDDSKDKKDDDSSKEKEDEAAKKAEEQKKKNAEYAKKRREQEEAERKKREEEIRVKTKREVELGIYKKNPYTDEPIVDEDDLEVYKTMKQLEEEGLNPIEDYPKRSAELARKRRAEEKEKAKKEAEEKEYFAKDIAEFKANHPDVDLKELAKDEEYLKFAEGKTKRWTTTEIYEAYMDKKEKSKKEKQEKEDDAKAEEQAKKSTKTPTTTHGKNSKTVDTSKMTDEEFIAYFEKKYNTN